MLTERRSYVRHKVHGPLFASFDGVTGGMILDLSEQGLSMQTAMPLESDRRVQLEIGLPDSRAPLEMTAYVAWADASGRAGIRFSELPEPARHRLDQWLTVNHKTLSRAAPKLAFQRDWSFLPPGRGNGTRSLSLEAEAADRESTPRISSATAEFQFHPLGSELNGALEVVGERAQTCFVVLEQPSP
jgi:PilZ domain